VTVLKVCPGRRTNTGQVCHLSLGLAELQTPVPDAVTGDTQSSWAGHGGEIRRVPESWQELAYAVVRVWPDQSRGGIQECRRAGEGSCDYRQNGRLPGRFDG
jgi:hypothetical protein